MAVAGISALVLFALAFASVFEIRLASAQVDASSSLPLTADTTTVPQILGTSTSTAPTGNDASSTAASTSAGDTSSTTTVATSTPESPAAAVQQPPQGLTEVHIVGTKYTDYFTDGTTTTSYPGDPAIDDNLNKPDAPIPSHGGLTWVHTTGGYLYDTPSGDLDVGDYALQPNGTSIQNAPPFVSSTSTPAAPAVVGPRHPPSVSPPTPPLCLKPRLRQIRTRRNHHHQTYRDRVQRPRQHPRRQQETD
jgi:hypothetical protein